VLAGIGGKTVEEAKRNMSYQEFTAWNEYAKQKGGLQHNDRLLATVCTQINRLTGGEANPSDFLPELRIHETHDEKEAEIGDVMNIFAMVAN
jgi:hypothetical protein